MLFKFISDPGHGWIETDRSLVNRLGIADKISSYSYQKDYAVYLEEDCDAAIFVDALKKYNITPEFVRVYQENTPIRRYQSYKK